MSEEISIKKATTYLFIFVLLIVGMFYVKNTLLEKAGSDQSTGAVVVLPETHGGKQVVELSFKNGNYYPQIIKVKQNTPVQISVDTNTIRGCMTNINIPAFGISKTVRKGDNVVEFIPNKKGEFSFSCPMGMGSGKLIVE